MPVMRATIRMVRNTEKASLTGQMAQLTLVISLTTTSKDQADTHGVTEDNMKANGATIKCTVLVCSHGTMAVAMKANITTIRKKAMECLHGQTVVNMMVNGKMENNTATAPTIPVVMKLSAGNGKRASASNG